jgi:predicted HicB family RNase H-like nuclease
MSDILNHKGYSARIQFDADDRIFFGRIAGIDDGVGFHADTVADVVDAFHEAVEDYLAACASVGKTPEKPYSGKVMLRIDPAIHARASIAAKLAGKSLNAFGEEALRQAAEKALA